MEECAPTAGTLRVGPCWWHLESDHVVTPRLKKPARLADPMCPNREMSATQRSLADLTHSLLLLVCPTHLKGCPVLLRNPILHLAYRVPHLVRLMHPIPHLAHRIPYLVRLMYPIPHPGRPMNQGRRESSVLPLLRFHEDVAQALNATGELTHCGWQFVLRAKRPVPAPS
jgi:hypothetical protein